jgi:hypothetical protein
MVSPCPGYGGELACRRCADRKEVIAIARVGPFVRLVLRSCCGVSARNGDSEDPWRFRRVARRK